MSERRALAPRLLTLEQAAEYCGVCTETFEQCCPVPAIDFGENRLRWELQRVDAWIDALPPKLRRGRTSDWAPPAHQPEPVQEPPRRRQAKPKAPTERNGRNRDKANRREWFKRRRRENPQFALNCNMRSAVYQSLKGEKKRASWQALVGYSLETLRAHLEAQFRDGMTWENIGRWHVDHIRPLASFKITGPDCPEFKAAWALSNLQPLWGPDNLKKGAKWTP